MKDTTMPANQGFQHEVFLSHSAKDKVAGRASSLSASNGVRCRSPRLAERLRTCRAVAARRLRQDGMNPKAEGNTWRWEAALIPTPIRQVLSTIRKHQVQALLMGGQACVFYGAAQFSRDVDLALLAEVENLTRLRAALDELQAVRIAVPRFDPELLARGHAVHFRCRHPLASGLRVDVMTRLRGLPEFPTLWARRTTLTEADGTAFDLMAVEDLVQAKKTQRSKDWPIIEALVEGSRLVTLAFR